MLQYFLSFEYVSALAQAKQIINLLLLDDISMQRARKESDGLLCTVWSLVKVRDQLPAQVVKGDRMEKWMFSRNDGERSGKMKDEEDEERVRKRGASKYIENGERREA